MKCIETLDGQGNNHVCTISILTVWDMYSRTAFLYYINLYYNFGDAKHNEKDKKEIYTYAQAVFSK